MNRNDRTADMTGASGISDASRRSLSLSGQCSGEQRSTISRDAARSSPLNTDAASCTISTSPVSSPGAMNSALLLLFFIAFFSGSVIPASAEIFRWIDKTNIIQYANTSPEWWKTEFLVFAGKRLVDKPQTLKKAGLPADTKDFTEKTDQVDAMQISQANGRLSFSSTGKGKTAETTEEKKADLNIVKPARIEDLEELPTGSVLVDENTGQYHTPDCHRIGMQGLDRFHYKIPLDKIRVYSGSDEARSAGFQPCPICGGKPK